MRATYPELYTALFAGGKDAPRLPADVSVRLISGQLQPGDVSVLRAAGYEQQAQECERLGQMQRDQRIADQALSSRENYQQAMACSAQWQTMVFLSAWLMSD